jgi:hypothetical protein
LFIALWRKALEWTGPERAAATRQSSRFDRNARMALLREDATDAYGALSGMIGDGSLTPADFRGQALAAMRAIDEVFYLIHPRGPKAAPATGVRHTLPHWLRELRDERLLRGVFAVDGDLMLLPRGPLLRGARHPTSTSADSLADRFAALSVAPIALTQEGRNIRLDVTVVAPAIGRGIPPGPHPGAEKIAFVPIAEAAGDIVATARTTSGQTWLNFQPRADLDAKGCILSALAEAGAIDLAVAPEFMVSEDHADALAAALLAAPAAARLVIAGSGTTTAKTGHQAWNEARALNSSGTEIWRQRKLWPAGIDAARARSFGVDPAPADDELAFEDTAAGDCLAIVDADALGRCVILICQDLEAQLLAEDLMTHFQPDWVFVPLLDSGVGVGRWMHRRAFDLSARAQCRFVLVSSTSLAAKAGYDDPACAMAVGPLHPAMTTGDNADVPRAFQSAEAQSHGAARFAIIQWRHGRWLSTTLKAE